MFKVKKHLLLSMAVWLEQVQERMCQTEQSIELVKMSSMVEGQEEGRE
jgi:hypothetical protein